MIFISYRKTSVFAPKRFNVVKRLKIREDSPFAWKILFKATGASTCDFIICVSTKNLKPCLKLFRRFQPLFVKKNLSKIFVTLIF